MNVWPRGMGGGAKMAYNRGIPTAANTGVKIGRKIRKCCHVRPTKFHTQFPEPSSLRLTPLIFLFRTYCPAIVPYVLRNKGSTHRGNETTLFSENSSLELPPIRQATRRTKWNFSEVHIEWTVGRKLHLTRKKKTFDASSRRVQPTPKRMPEYLREKQSRDEKFTTTFQSPQSATKYNFCLSELFAI